MLQIAKRRGIRDMHSSLDFLPLTPGRELILRILRVVGSSSEEDEHRHWHRATTKRSSEKNATTASLFYCNLEESKGYKGKTCPPNSTGI